MREFFHPNSVAVVGVSSSPNNLARRILINLKTLGFAGKVWGIGPRDEEIEGFPVLQTISELPEAVDIAVILIPAPKVPDILEECGQKGINRIIVESGGFAEFEGEGSETQQRVRTILKQYNMRMIGPNCIGVISQRNGFASPFARLDGRPKAGDVSILSQSGGVGLSMLASLKHHFTGINEFCSYGNALDVNEADIVEHYSDDPETKIIVGYLESINHGRRLMDIASRSKKPIVILKSNVHEATQSIAGSHSASLAQDDRLVSAAFKQAGILRVRNEEAMVQGVSTMTLPPMTGKRLAVVSRSGGHAVNAADQANDAGFVLPQFDEEFHSKLGRFFKNSIINIQNPLDYGQIFYDPSIVGILEEVLQLDDVDGVLLIHVYHNRRHGELAHQLLGQVRPLMERYNKPVSVVLHTEPNERHLVAEMCNMPVFSTTLEGVQALANSRDSYRLLQTRKPLKQDTQPLDEEAEQAVSTLMTATSSPSLPECLDLMKTLELPVPKQRLVGDRVGAYQAAADLKAPVALKLIHDDASHKTELGGVLLNLETPNAAAEGYDKLAAIAKEHALATEGSPKVLVQAMATPGVEMIVGGRQDESFGPAVLTGSGGILAELVEDVTMRLAPISQDDALSMLRDIKGSKLLDGFRGSPEADKDALARVIETIANLLATTPEIAEIDLNPVIVHPVGKGVTIVDARIVKKA